VVLKATAAVSRALFVALVVIVEVPDAWASPRQPSQAQPADGNAQGAAQPPKQPPAPLFPRHGRGIYRNANGKDVIDATPQSPPLVTDDPAVPDDGQYEINLLARLDHTRLEQHIDLLDVDANYGCRPRIAGARVPMQLKLEVPLSAARASGTPFTVGAGVTAAGVKMNFYDDERRGISLSWYPQLEFAMPGGRGVKKGLADPGQTIVLPLLAAREFHELTMVFNAALETPLHDPTRRTTTELGAAVGRALTRKDAVMVELRTDSTLNFRQDRLVFVNAGLIHGVRHIVTYASIGRSVVSSDGTVHLYGGVGIKVQIDTKKREG